MEKTEFCVTVWRAPILAMPPVVLGRAGEFMMKDWSVALSSSFEKRIVITIVRWFEPAGSLA